MARKSEKQLVFTRRSIFLGGVQLAAFSALAARLYYLQFINAEKYATLSENNRIKLQLIAPPRGKILDRNGKPMAITNINYRLFIDYSAISQDTLKYTIEKLKKLIEIADKKIEEIEGIKVSSIAPPILVKSSLEWDEVSLIELNIMELTGVMIDIGQIRYYPLFEKAAHLLGYVSAVNKNELSENDLPLLRLPDFKIGKNGVEKMLEDRLRGKAGIRQLEVNVHGMPVREISKTESIAGDNISLTIDKDLQEYAAELIKDESASVLVMDIDTGNILTMLSMPAFDPNIFSSGISNEYWKQLTSNKKSPLLNKSIAGQYPPASTFKMIVGLAALEAGIINSYSTVYCPGHFFLGRHRFNCWKVGGHGTVNYHEAIQQSCDTFFYTVAQKLGVEKIVDMAHRFGLGELHNIGLVGEKDGNVPTPHWKKKAHNQRWSGGDTINYAIGQGYSLATPLQLMVMVARMASGMKVEPRLFVDEGQENPVFPAMNVSEDLLELNRKAMISVNNDRRGTAYYKRIIDPRFKMAGKTGTAQVRKITKRGQDQNLIDWESRHHALFVGFAPIDKPKFACSVVIEHGGGGSAAAAPVARDILLRTQQIAAGVELIPQEPSAIYSNTTTNNPEPIEERTEDIEDTATTRDGFTDITDKLEEYQ
ncbi:MAG: penicillin-binding protein 2 [Rickettsiales bacterium]